MHAYAASISVLVSTHVAPVLHMNEALFITVPKIPLSTYVYKLIDSSPLLCILRSEHSLVEWLAYGRKTRRIKK